MAGEAASAASSYLPWIQAGSNLLSAVGGLNGKNAEPGLASSGTGATYTNTDFDFSGFTAATGKASAVGATIKKSDSLGDSLGGGLSDLIGNTSPVLVFGVAIGAALLWRVLKK